jgi:hypothetical protein
MRSTDLVQNLSTRDKTLRRNSLTHAVGRSYSTILPSSRKVIQYNIALPQVTFPPADKNKVCEYVAFALQVSIQYI